MPPKENEDKAKRQKYKAENECVKSILLGADDDAATATTFVVVVVVQAKRNPIRSHVTMVYLHLSQRTSILIAFASILFECLLLF